MKAARGRRGCGRDRGGAGGRRVVYLGHAGDGLEGGGKGGVCVDGDGGAVAVPGCM